MRRNLPNVIHLMANVVNEWHWKWVSVGEIGQDIFIAMIRL